MTRNWQTPIICPQQRVEAGWIDYNGHLNMAFYHVMFDRAVDHVYDLLGIGAEYVSASDGSCFTMEVHVNYLNELVVDDPVIINFQLLDADSKRLHFFQEMRHAESNELAATSEQLALHVDMRQRASAPFPDRLKDGIAALLQQHNRLPVPVQAGGKIGIRHK